MNKQREKTEQEIERRVEESRMEKKESRKEHRKEHKEQITTDFEILDWINIEKEEKQKIEGRIAVFCSIKKICAGEIPQETQVKNRARTANCQRNSMWNFPGLIKNWVEFPRMTKKKWCRISRGLGFWPLKFP